MVKYSQEMKEKGRNSEMERQSMKENSITVVFADHDQSQVNAFKLYAENESNITLYGTANSGAELLRVLREVACPQIIVVDAQLRDISLFDLVGRMRDLQMEKIPRMIAAGANLSVDVQERLLTSGYDDVILKPYHVKALISRMAALATSDRLKAYNINIATEDFLDAMGTDYGKLGVRYVRKVIGLILINEWRFNITAAYDKIAEEENTNGEGVATAVRRVIRQIHERNRPQYQEMCEYYGKAEGKQLSNWEFLSLLARMVERRLS